MLVFSTWKDPIDWKTPPIDFLQIGVVYYSSVIASNSTQILAAAIFRNKDCGWWLGVVVGAVAAMGVWPCCAFLATFLINFRFCFQHAPQRVSKQLCNQEQELRDVAESGAMRFVRYTWLRDELCKNGGKLKPRQEMPDE